jgi:hypothetical protein
MAAMAVAKPWTGAHLGTEQVGVLRSLINNVPQDDARDHDQTLRPLLSSLFVACNVLKAVYRSKRAFPLRPVAPLLCRFPGRPADLSTMPT